MKHGPPPNHIPRAKGGVHAAIALRMLRTGPVTFARLVAELPPTVGAKSKTEEARARIRRDRAMRAFDDLLQQGKARRVDRGVYEITDHGREAGQ